MTVERVVPGEAALNERFKGPLDSPDGDTVIIVDHGTLDVFADRGSTTLSMLTFAGPEWRARVEGRAWLAEL